MVGSADMTNKRALEPGMSMSLFKSPEYAQEVWTWLDKHGDTPVLRENFKHLVSICTVKPAKVAVQPLQRKSSDVQVLSTSRAQTQDYGQSLQHQRSTRFIPAASISGRPAATARPASASAARRKLVVGHRPSTAAPGISRSSISCDLAHSSSQPVLTASALLPANGRTLARKAELARPPSRPRPPLPSSEACLPREPNKTATTESGHAVMDSATLSRLADSESVGADVLVVPSVDQSVPDKLLSSQPAAQRCSSGAATVLPGADAAAGPQAEGCVPVVSDKAAGDGTASLVTKPSLAEAQPADHATANPVTVQQQQQQPSCSHQADLQSPKLASVQKDTDQQSSRPSTAGSKKGSTSPFDRRLALLHKGLPTHMPCPAPSRPPTRGHRPSTLPAPSTAPGGFLSSATRPPSTATAEPPNTVTADASLLAEQLNGGTSPLEQSGGGSMAKPASSVKSGSLQQGATAAAVLGKDLGLTKPSSPTSVLPGGGLGDTTYTSFHGLADAYPELYKAAAEEGKAHKASSRALQSVVGETLKGNPDLWKQQLKSAYTVCNDRLKQDAGWGSMDGVWDGQFLEWVGRSQLYSEDLLAPEAVQDLAQWMESAAPGDKRDMMALLRNLHATVSPTGPHLQSVSHATHTRQVPFASVKETERELQRGTRPVAPLSTMYKEQPASLADKKGKAVQVPAEGAAQCETSTGSQVQSVPKLRGINVNAVPSKGTFRSSINLSQGAPATIKSTYGDTHGASMPQLMAAVQTVAQQHAEAQKPVQVTCPFGTLDPLMDRAHLAAFPVPSGLLQATTELHTDAQRNGLDATQYGQSFCSTAFKGNAAAILAAAQREKEASKIAGSRTTIPMGKKAVNCVPLYDTTYHDESKARALDVSQQRASAEHIRNLYHSPTATVGCVTRSH